MFRRIDVNIRKPPEYVPESQSRYSKVCFQKRLFSANGVDPTLLSTVPHVPGMIR